jgi:hypothetical protein
LFKYALKRHNFAGEFLHAMHRDFMLRKRRSSSLASPLPARVGHMLMRLIRENESLPEIRI